MAITSRFLGAFLTVQVVSAPCWPVGCRLPRPVRRPQVLTRETDEAAFMELTDATVVVPAGLSRPESKAIAVLVEEVESRTGRRWNVQTTWPRENRPIVAVAPATALPAQAVALLGGPGAGRPKAEGFRICTQAKDRVAVIAGNDARGVLFGVGRFLRELRMTSGKVLVPAEWTLATAPRYAIRGHQLGYRPKTNSYDGWDLPQWDRYIRELAIFGVNSVELIPPRSDDSSDSPHFPRPPMAMLVGMSRLCDDYGLDVWLWNAALERDYTDPAVVAREMSAYEALFRDVPRLDAVFVPGGDPGHTAPSVLMPFLEKEAEVLRRYHPRAQMWVSTQGFDKTWLEEFYAILGGEPKWLTGVVYGPHTRDSLAATRAAVPRRYPIRHYPDITHTRECQFPVPSWDLAFASTEGREPINPRPRQYTTIFRATQSDTAGFIAYSEGCNDDVNKFVWTALGWDQDVSVIETLRQYSRFFIGQTYTDAFAEALLSLERNWEGPVLTNANIETSLQQFQDMERSASPRELLNWRFQQGLYRAYYDAFVRRRLIHETELEAKATDELRRAGEIGALPHRAGAASAGKSVRRAGRTGPPCPGFRAGRGTVSEYPHATQRDAIPGDRCGARRKSRRHRRAIKQSTLARNSVRGGSLARGRKESAGRDRRDRAPDRSRTGWLLRRSG